MRALSSRLEYDVPCSRLCLHRTSCEWLKRIKEQKQSARQVINNIGPITGPFVAVADEPRAPAFPGRAIAVPTAPLQMMPIDRAVPIAME